MGAAVCHHRDEESDASSSGSATESDSSGDEAEKPSLLQRIAGCIQRRGAFAPSADLKVGSFDSMPKALLVNNTGKKIEDYFNVDKSKVLGEGGYATVALAKDKRTGEERAVKVIQKALVADRSRLQREIDIVMLLDHPNINKLYQTFEDRRCIYLVLELCQGGELFDRIIEEGHLSERHAAIIMQQVFRAVHYMHDKGVCHRDMKPENFLFQHKAPIEGNTLKLIDFGIAHTFRKPTDTFSTKTGTPYYVAPEVLAHWSNYGKEVDMWACGVIMYVLLSGRLPFKGRDEEATLKAVTSAKFVFPPEKFGKVSNEAKNLIKFLLAKNPTERATSGQALQDTWTAHHAPTAEAVSIGADLIDSLRAFRGKNKLQKAALHAVARQLDEQHIQKLRSIFMQMDTDSDGTLTVEEMMTGLQQNGMVLNDELRDLVQSIDADGSGEIDYTEFLAATLERRLFNTEDACWAAFRVFDLDDDGRISRKELQTVLATGQLDKVVGKEIDALLAQVDTDGDGHIDFDEFMVMMRGPAVPRGKSSLGKTGWGQ
mmetsp:Transcript_29938/g.79375  ORF Transcript_29938/g.79375 Transcript_29938/m.79375 type:complete len:543 (-) Transcript_29938:102-1730(-)